jgi:hypothetical protein
MADCYRLREDRYVDGMGWRAEFLKSLFNGTDTAAGRR